MKDSKEEFIKKLTRAMRELRQQRLAEIELKREGSRQADNFLYEMRTRLSRDKIKLKHR